MEYPEYYKILELPLSAEPEEIKLQFRKFAKKYHPDMHPDDRNAEEMFKKLSEAYETLIDENKRAAYDLQWKKQRDKEQKARKKSSASAKKNSEKQKSSTPSPSHSVSEPSIKTENRNTKENESDIKVYKRTNVHQRKKIYKNFSLKIIRFLRFFLGLTAFFAIMFLSAPKIIENKEKITTSLPELNDIFLGFENYFLRREIVKNNVGEAKKILQKQSDEDSEAVVNLKNSAGYTLLILSQTAEMTEMLIENGAEVNYQAPDGMTALLSAVKKNNIEQLKVLLAHKANANIIDRESGYSALMLSTSNDIAYLLLKAGANPNFVAKDGKTALSKAASEHNRNRLNLLQQYGAQINWSDVIVEK